MAYLATESSPGVAAGRSRDRRIRPRGEPGHPGDPRPDRPARLPGIRSKPLDNPVRPKPTYQSDEANARLLGAVLRHVPRDLSEARGASLPLLTTLMSLDAARGTDLASRLVFIAAMNHRTADERRTAEYLLRHRDATLDGRRSCLKLLRAARCAAEMEVQRRYRREVPVPVDSLVSRVGEQPVTRDGDPSVGEVVLDKLRVVIGRGPTTSLCREWLLDAVVVALELAERHALNGGRGPSLLAMRADARKQSRLVTHLRREFGVEVAAQRLARLLVGPDSSPIETALMWWSALPRATAEDVPPDIRGRWDRDLRAADVAAARRRELGSPT